MIGQIQNPPAGQNIENNQIRDIKNRYYQNRVLCPAHLQKSALAIAVAELALNAIEKNVQNLVKP